MTENNTSAWLDLYWLPLGAGGHCVHLNGQLYERMAAMHQRRPACDLYHSALQARLDQVTYAIEMGPVWNVTASDRGVVCQGAVGTRWLGRFHAFQYEVRCWPGGYIPDLGEAVGGPRRLSDDPRQVGDVLDVLHRAPPLTWGRDELRCGEMWNSNSVVSWALACTRHDMARIHPPLHGRAPGWNAGLALAGRTSHAVAKAT